jgi:excisionase family DNA binding protein
MRARSGTVGDIQTWLSPAEAARQLGVMPTRVRQLAEDGRLATVRTSLSRLVDPASVERLIAQRAERRAGVA